MKEITKKLNQNMPHDDFMAECNAIDIYTDILEKDSKELYRKMPEVGEICLFHDEPLLNIVNYPDGCSKLIAEFYKMEDGKFVTPDDYGFKYVTRLHNKGIL